MNDFRPEWTEQDIIINYRVAQNELCDAINKKKTALENPNFKLSQKGKLTIAGIKAEINQIKNMTRLKNKKSEELQYIPNETVNQIEGDEVFATYDLGCSSALITAGFELLTLDKANPKKVQFVFRREVGIEKVVEDYWADKLEVRARAFFDNIKMLKNRIYSE